MPTWLLPRTIYPSLPDHCTPENDFLTRLSSDFHTCVPTPLSFLSTLLGSLSILSWLFAQLPQIFKNYTLKSASGLSIYFLIEWCLGDTTNLLGALLTGQATWQVIVAFYYTFVDVVLVGQYLWYTHFKRWREERSQLFVGTQARRDGDNSREVIEGIPTSDNSSEQLPSDDGKTATETHLSATKPRDVGMNVFRIANFSSSPREKGTPSSHRTINSLQRSPPSLGPSPKTLLLISMLCAVLTNASPLHPSPFILTSAEPEPSNKQFVGRILSWTSTLLYLGSRLPQIYKNHIRRSTSGLSPSLFVAAFFGNLFYSTSLLTNPLAWASYPAYGHHGWAGPDGSDRTEWISLAAPFWLGAAGVLFLDAAVGVQFLMFGEGRGGKKVVRVKDSRGRSRWRRVSGWMRGWVPSPSPSRLAAEEAVESQRPLLDRGASGDGGYGSV
ncbi:hypothetical protein MMC24_005711 [Lignoscripta atroalba]|nr:hypothetical protein [Lignoscripta atroalba]